MSEDVRAQSVQAEHERMLALQQKTNQRLRDLELANEEKASLLRAALLDRAHLSPELLELKRAETLQHIRERINSVIAAPTEVQPKVLDTTSSEIAETVLSAEAALDKVKKVSTRQISQDRAPVSAFDAAILSMRHQLEPSFSASTLISPASPQRNHSDKNKSFSDISTSTAGTGQTTWGRMAQLLSPRGRPSQMASTEYFPALASHDHVASLSLAWLP